ncbi:Intracellular distribution of mitochondria [Malassezia sp. CBS 17886]|nr:Intracellular distribution of mitochondria [Malassezia sp. CBS 17886]
MPEESKAHDSSAAADAAPADTQTFELQLQLPARPLLPKQAVALGLPETPAPLRVAVTPQESLSDLRATISDSPEGYWLGAFAFRRPHARENVGEWQPLQEVFADVPVDARVLDVVHVAPTEADVRAHLQRLRDLLTGGQPEASALCVDAGASVYDAVAHPRAWGADTDAAAAREWTAWTRAGVDTVMPRAAHAPRALARCVRQIALSAWNPPPRHLALQGHLLYLQVDTLEGEVLHVTASAAGYCVNGSTSHRFDPAPHADARHQASASLFDVLCAASPLFLKGFAALFNDPVAKRDYVSALPLVNALPAAPWLARLPKHDADRQRTQAAFLLTGAYAADTLDSSRDWNEELQATRELPRGTLAERLMRDRVLHRVYAEFTLAAARAVQRVAGGGVQAMNEGDSARAHMYLFNNLFVSRGIDGVDVYPYLGGDEAAHAAVAKDVAGVRAFSALDEPGLSLLGTAVVDWLGERWVVQSIVPGLFRVSDGGGSPDAQVAYGGVEGPDVVHTDAAFDELFRAPARRLHLAQHSIADAQGAAHALRLSVDCKGLRGADGRRYLLDLSRLTPVDVAWLDEDGGPVLEQAGSGAGSASAAPYPHRMALLRPELLEIVWDMRLRAYARAQMAERAARGEAEDAPVDLSGFELAFNPDAFVQFCVDGHVIVPVADETDAGVRAVREAGAYLRGEAVVRLVSDVAAGLVSAVDGFALTQQMHARGINMRYLGRIANLSQASESARLDPAVMSKVGPGYEALLRSFRRVVVQEMIVRAAKHRLRAYLRSAGPSETAALVAHVLNCLLGTRVCARPQPADTPLHEPGALWRTLTPSALADEVRAEVAARFRFALPATWRDDVHAPQTLRALCLRTGVQLRLQPYVFGEADAPPPPHVQPPAPKTVARGRRAATHAPALTPPPRTTTFVPDDVLALVPLVKTSTPKSALVEEAFEAGRIAFARGERELGAELLLEGLGFHEQVYGLLHPDTARSFSLFASLAHHYVGMQAREAKDGGIKGDKQGQERQEAQEAQEKQEEGQEGQGEQEKQEGQEGTARTPDGAPSQEDAPSNIVQEAVTLANALRFQRQAVTISERTMGLDHPDTMVQYMNLAAIERSAGNLDAALRCQGRVLELWQLLYGGDHPDTIHTLTSVALVLQARRDFAASLHVYEAAHDLARRLFGDESIYTGNLAHELSQALTLHGDLKSAIAVEKEALRILRERLGDEDALTKESQTFLSSLTTSAVRVAKLEAAARQQVARTPLRAPPRALEPASERSSALPSLGDRSIDELVEYIQGAGGARKRALRRPRRARA